jgi:penicillin-binding protein 1C
VIREVFAEGTEPAKTCPLSHEQREPGSGRGPAGWGARVPARGLVIVSPADGDVYKLDPVLRGEFQTIRLRAALADGLRPDAVEWWVDGTKVGEAGPPYSLAWRLKPGSYTIRARARSRSGTEESPAVRITVLS